MDSATTDSRPSSLDETWSAVAARLRDQLSHGNFHAWFGGARLLDRQGSEFVIEVPTPLHEEWIQERYRDALEAALADTCGIRPSSIDFAIAAPGAASDIAAEAALAEYEEAKQSGADAYYPVLFAQVSLPHTERDEVGYERTNGLLRFRLTSTLGLTPPFGIIPRLTMAWLATTVTRQQDREISLGHSISSFLAGIGMPQPTGGANGSLGRARGQMIRIFSSVFSAYYVGPLKPRAEGARSRSRMVPAPGADGGPEGILLENVLITESLQMLWDPKRLDYAMLWNSNVVLTERFYAALRHAFPIELRTLQALRKEGSLAIDLYVWLTWRNSHLRKRTTIPWELVETQFGADYGRTRDFRRQVLRKLVAVQHEYPGLQADCTPAGLVLTPSPTAVRMLGQR